MKAHFSLIALIAAGLILQGCGHEGPDSSNRGGPQLAKQTDSSKGGSTPAATPAPQGANQASSGQQEANRAPANQHAPVPKPAQKEPTRAVQAQTLPYFRGEKAVVAPHKLHHTRPTQRSDDAENQAVVAAGRKAGQTQRFAGLGGGAASATVAEETIPSSAGTMTSAAAATPSLSTTTTASAAPSSSASADGSISGPATSENSAPTRPIGSTPTQTTASAATSASAGSNPASNRQLDRYRVNELDKLTAKNSKMIADVDSRATEGIHNAMSKANDADSHAVDAGNRTRQTQQATGRIGSVEETVAKIDRYYPVAQAEIRFRPGQAALSKKAKEALDEMATVLKGQHGYIVEVQGFAPGSGSTAIENSRSMTQMVVRYLVLNHDVPFYRIYTVGMGNAPIQAENGKKVRTDGGRVEINLLKTSLGDVGSSATANSSGSTGEVTGAVTTVAPASNRTEQPATPATNVAPASQPSNTGVTTKKPSSPSKPPQP
jgi:outer membrane protein OmpA-like peptidoglycan-associated protein